MKKSWKAGILATAMAVAVTFAGCEVSRTCISHIDRDQNGRCDNCGTAMEVIVSNVETLTIKVKPQKDYYAFNETLEYSDGVLHVVYNDGTPEEDIPFTSDKVTVKAPNMSSAGKKNVEVQYNGKTVRYQIEVGSARYEVSFNMGEGFTGAGVPSQQVIISSFATKPADPEREGYDFVNWYADAELTNEFNFDVTPIMAPITLYASWTQKFRVTYKANYTGGTDKTDYTVKGKIDNKTPAEREGYKFAGWFYDTECQTRVDYDATLTQNVDVYAKWVSDSANFFTVTFNHNYGDTPVTTTAEAVENSPVTAPATPTRANVTTKGHQAQSFTFNGWYKDPECTQKYDFKTNVTGDFTLYAKWTGTYIFEAEHVSLTVDGTPNGTPLQGVGASGGSTGKDMVDPPAPGMEGINASNGYYVTYLFAENLALIFNITSDRDVADATLVFRITCESVPFILDPNENDMEVDNPMQPGTTVLYSKYTILCNDEPINYESIEILDAAGHEATGGRRPFSDHTLAVNLSLKKGINTFMFITDNSHGMGGTMSGTAPVIDCIKITTSANLSWTPVTDNEFGQ